MLKKRILVISSANIDFVQRMRRVPYSGETVVEPGIGYSYVPGGKGANSAITFARLGADCVFACKLGKDSNGKRLAAMYAKEGIDTRYILEDPEVPTGLASILVEENGKNRIIVYPGANMTMTPEKISEKEAQVHPNRNIILRALGVDEKVEADIEFFPYTSGTLLLCSDGLSNYFDKDFFLKTLESERSCEEQVHLLIDYANECGGADNITAVVIKLN